MGSRSASRLLVVCIAWAPCTACLLDWDGLRSDGSSNGDGGSVTDGGPSDAGQDGGTKDSGGKDTGSDASACGDKVVVVNELQSGGSNGPADEFVELFNPSTCDVALSGWSLRYSSSSGSNPFPDWTGGASDALPANGYVVIGGASYQGQVLGRFGNTGGTLAAAGGGIGLYDRNGTVIDSVAYGTVNSTHPFLRPAGGQAAPAPGVGQSIGRLPNGKNTNVTKDDFVILSSPSPGAKNT